MEFPDHSTIVSHIGNELTDYGRPVREAFVSVARVVYPARVESTHKACPAWRTDRALAIGVGERGSLGYQLINDRSANKGIPQGTNGVKTLLVGAVPKYVWLFIHFKIESHRY